jgi:hypothetical protein
MLSVRSKIVAESVVHDRNESERTSGDHDTDLTEGIGRRIPHSRPPTVCSSLGQGMISALTTAAAEGVNLAVAGVCGGLATAS